MERRIFLTTLAGGLLAVPLTAEGQQAGKRNFSWGASLQSWYRLPLGGRSTAQALRVAPCSPPALPCPHPSRPRVSFWASCRPYLVFFAVKFNVAPVPARNVPLMLFPITVPLKPPTPFSNTSTPSLRVPETGLVIPLR
jgi:hypothetical protein